MRSDTRLACNRLPFQTDSSCDRGDVDIHVFDDFPLCSPINPTPPEAGLPQIDMQVVPITPPPCTCVRVDIKGSGTVEDRKNKDIELKTEFKSIGDCCDGNYRANIDLKVPCIPFNISGGSDSHPVSFEQVCGLESPSGEFNLGIGIDSKNHCVVSIKPRIKLTLPRTPETRIEVCPESSSNVEMEGSLGGTGRFTLGYEESDLGSSVCGRVHRFCPSLKLDLPCPIPDGVIALKSSIKWKLRGDESFKIPIESEFVVYGGIGEGFEGWWRGLSAAALNEEDTAHLPVFECGPHGQTVTTGSIKLLSVTSLELALRADERPGLFFRLPDWMFKNLSLAHVSPLSFSGRLNLDLTRLIAYVGIKTWREYFYSKPKITIEGRIDVKHVNTKAIADGLTLASLSVCKIELPDETPTLELSLPCPLPEGDIKKEFSWIRDISGESSSFGSSLSSSLSSSNYEVKECSLRKIKISIPCPLDALAEKRPKINKKVKWSDASDSSASLFSVESSDCAFKIPDETLQLHIPCPIKLQEPVKTRIRVEFTDDSDMADYSASAPILDTDNNSSTCEFKIPKSNQVVLRIPRGGGGGGGGGGCQLGGVHLLTDSGSSDDILVNTHESGPTADACYRNLRVQRNSDFRLLTIEGEGCAGSETEDLYLMNRKIKFSSAPDSNVKFTISKGDKYGTVNIQMGVYYV